jgi:hypothetical protein
MYPDLRIYKRPDGVAASKPGNPRDIIMNPVKFSAEVYQESSLF